MEDLATDDLAVAISSVAILGVCHDYYDDDDDDDDEDLVKPLVIMIDDNDIYNGRPG